MRHRDGHLRELRRLDSLPDATTARSTPQASACDVVPEDVRVIVYGVRRPVLPLWWPAGEKCACPQGASCRATGKHPITDLVPHGVKDASRDPVVVRKWWSQYPHANAALAVGDGLFVVDIDPRNDGVESIKRLQAEHGQLPPTVTAATGGGGWHLLFRGLEGYKLPGKLAQGVDIKAAGGYIVIAPSIHASGRRYRWLPGKSPIDIPPAAPPTWLARLLTERIDRPCEAVDASTPAPMLVVDRARRYLAKCDPAVSGQGGHAVCFRAAQALVRGFGLSESQALEILRSEYNPRCSPPWSERELRHKVQQASLRGEMVVGGLL